MNNRVTTCLENLEMSGNLIAVSEMSGNLVKVLKMSGNCQGKNFVRENVQTAEFCLFPYFIFVLLWITMCVNLCIHSFWQLSAFIV